MAHVDGAVLAVPTANKDAYKAFSEKMAVVFQEKGVTEYRECWGVDVQPGKTNSFLSAVMCKEDETVVLSWMTWPDKATRDAAWEDIGKMDFGMEEMPFDGSRMIFGGFEVLVDG